MSEAELSGKDGTSDPRNRRERVTSDGAPVTAAIPVPMRGATDADAAYARSLVRAQLRLALGCLVGFIVVAGALALVLLVVPALDSIVIAGVPLPWLLHAYGFYPIITVFALIYVRSASRNERRYRVLREQSA